VFLYDLLNFFLLEVLELILLQVETDFSAATKRGIGGIGGDGECATGCGFPNILFVVVVFRDDLDALGNEVGRVEADTELTDHRNVGTRAESLHESLEVDGFARR